MTKMTVCDRCGQWIDKNWNGIPLTVKNTTGTGGPNTIHVCLDCHTDIRDELYDLLVSDFEYEHKYGIMNE